MDPFEGLNASEAAIFADPWLRAWTGMSSIRTRPFPEGFAAAKLFSLIFESFWDTTPTGCGLIGALSRWIVVFSISGTLRFPWVTERSKWMESVSCKSGRAGSSATRSISIAPS